jgi:multidrug resistance efflux pump
LPGRSRAGPRPTAAIASGFNASGIEEAEAGRVRADAMLKRWTNEFQRLQRLINGVIDPTTVDEAQMQVEAAKASRAELEAKIQLMRAARDESAAKREAVYPSLPRPVSSR